MPKKTKYSKMIEKSITKITKKKRRSIYILCRYEFECFSFFDIAVLFSAGNAKKNVFTVFTVPIVTIDGFILDLKI